MHRTLNETHFFFLSSFTILFRYGNSKNHRADFYRIFSRSYTVTESNPNATRVYTLRTSIFYKTVYNFEYHDGSLPIRKIAKFVQVHTRIMFENVVTAAEWTQVYTCVFIRTRSGHKFVTDVPYLFTRILPI